MRGNIEKRKITKCEVIMEALKEKTFYGDVVLLCPDPLTREIMEVAKV